MSHDCDGIAFLESCFAKCSDGYSPVRITSFTLSCGSNGFLVHAILSRWRSLVLPEQCAPRRRHRGGLGLPMGEACAVTCADGYNAAGDTDTTSTCVFDPELQSMSLEGSTHSCRSAPCDISTLMPFSIVTSDGPNRQWSDFRDGGFHCFDLRFRRSLGERPNASASRLRSTDVLHWRPLAQRLFVWT